MNLLGPDSSVETGPAPRASAAASAPPAAERLSELSPQQWKSGLAAWLGWLFDGLDMHLYTLVALPFVAALMEKEKTDPEVGQASAWIQAAFLIGWALGGGFFGVIGDRIGRARALMLTILTYALFTGLSYFAQAWWHLLILRFVAALGIGGEWAVGSALLSETWPRRWRPWMAAVLQSAVNCGTLLASLAVFVLSSSPPRTVFLVGVLPALLVLWIRRAVPEPEEWHHARRQSAANAPRFRDLFRGSVRRTTLLTLGVCALSLTAHWAFMFWCFQHLRGLPQLATWSDAERSELVSWAMVALMVSAIAGNFLAAAIARRLGYRWTIVLFCLIYPAVLLGGYGVERSHTELWPWLAAAGASQGVFALFTMYMPPLFPTLLRTSGAGFCYNFGRVAAAFGTVFFGLFSKVGDFRMAIYNAAFLFVPAAALALLLPEPGDEPRGGREPMRAEAP